MRTLPYERTEASVQMFTGLLLKDPSLRICSHKERFVHALNTFQPVKLAYTDAYCIEFSRSEVLDRVLVDSGGVTQQEIESRSYSMNKEQQLIVGELVPHAYEKLRSQSEEAHRLTTLLVNTLFFCNTKSGGGSLVQNLGLLWFSPKKHWTLDFYVESIFHEALHQQLFLEDMIYGLFGDVEMLSDEESQVISNFLFVKRRIDGAFHGIFVATELACFYRSVGNRTKADSFLPDLSRTVGEMERVILESKNRHRYLLTERGEELFFQLKEAIANLRAQ